MVLKKEMKGKAPARKNQRSWKRMLEEMEEGLNQMAAEARKMKAETGIMKEEGRNAEEELGAKELELGLVKREHMMAIEENAALQRRFDAALLMLARDARAPPRRRRPFFSVPGSKSCGG